MLTLIHVKCRTLGLWPIVGVPPILSCCDVIGLALALETYKSVSLANGSGVIGYLWTDAKLDRQKACWCSGSSHCRGRMSSRCILGSSLCRREPRLSPTASSDSVDALEFDSTARSLASHGRFGRMILCQAPSNGEILLPQIQQPPLDHLVPCHACEADAFLGASRILFGSVSHRPLGSASHSELRRAACLAATIQRRNSRRSSPALLLFG
jgi:hypothetical protein